MKVKPYYLRSGDTFGTIASAANLELPELLAENPHVVNPYLVYEGLGILIPASMSEDVIHRTLAVAGDPSDVPLWFKIATREEGVAEYPGEANNPRILEYHASTKLKRELASKDQTAWCSSFANWCFESAQLAGTDSAWAQDWMRWGEPLSEPRTGCVAVFSRKNAGKEGGHVGFFISETEDSVRILGGNQGNKVSRDFFPKDGKKGLENYKLLGYRWVAH